jgi:hypothetical protein
MNSIADARYWLSNKTLHTSRTMKYDQSFQKFQMVTPTFELILWFNISFISCQQMSHSALVQLLCQCYFDVVYFWNTRDVSEIRSVTASILFIPLMFIRVYAYSFDFKFTFSVNLSRAIHKGLIINQLFKNSFHLIESQSLLFCSQ